MLNINMLDNKIGKYIESKKLKAEDVESVELGITTSDLQFVDVSRSEGLSDRIELLNESKGLSTKEGFNQYATEMKELNRSMIKSCDEYAGLADYLGIEDEKEIKKLSKEQILKGTTYIQFLEDVKNKRNQLAHGTTSFAECGRYYAINDLEKIKNETVIFLNSILQGMKKYYDEKTYLKVANN